jgi:hypothetical protein
VLLGMLLLGELLELADERREASVSRPWRSW